MRRFALVLMVFGWLVPPGDVRAAGNIAVDAFYGRWQGTGMAETPGSVYFSMTARDMDVQIAPKGEGFTVSWTTVLRQGGDPDNPDVKRKSTTIDFLPTAVPSVFKSTNAGDPLSGEPLTWARIKRQTLTVYLMLIDPEGAYVVQSYDRTLTGFGMELEFRRIRDDEPERRVKAKLIRVQD